MHALVTYIPKFEKVLRDARASSAESTVAFSKAAPMESTGASRMRNRRVLKFARRLISHSGTPGYKLRDRTRQTVLTSVCTAVRSNRESFESFSIGATTEQTSKSISSPRAITFPAMKSRRSRSCFRSRRLFPRNSVADQSRIHKVARPELPRGEILRLGDRARRQGRERRGGP